MSRPLLIGAALGLLVRLGLAPFTSWSPDMVPWLVFLQDMWHGVALYQHLTFSYPPLFAYLIALFAGPVAAWAGTPDLATSPDPLRALSLQTDLVSATITSPAFNLAVKLPVILCDVGTGLLLAALVREASGSDDGPRLDCEEAELRPIDSHCHDDDAVLREKHPLVNVRLGDTVLISASRSDLVGLMWFFNPLAIWVSAVHGQFDPIPAFLTVLAMALLWRRQWFGVGVALSIGALFKLYPAYLLPSAAYFALLDAWPLLRTGLAWRTMVTPLRDLGLLAMGFAVPLAVFLPPLIHTQVLTAVFSRGETTAVGSGLDLWFPTILPGVRDFIQHFSRGYSAALTVILYAGFIAVLAGAASGWAQHRNRIAVATAAQLMALLLLAAPNTNPQFVVWVLPFVVLGWGLDCSYGRMWLPLSLTPVLFYLAMWALNPIGMLLPAVSYLSWPMTPAAAASSLAHSLALTGPMGTGLRLWMMVVIAAAVVVELAIVLVRPGLPLAAQLAIWGRRRRLVMGFGL